MTDKDLLELCPAAYKASHSEEECLEFMHKIVNVPDDTHLGFFRTLCMYFHVPYVNPFNVSRGEIQHAVYVEGVKVIYGCESMGVFVGSLLTGLMLQNKQNVDTLNIIRTSFMFTASGVLMGINKELYDAVKRYVESNHPGLLDLIPYQEDMIWDPDSCEWRAQAASPLHMALCRYNGLSDPAASIYMVSPEEAPVTVTLDNCVVVYGKETAGNFVGYLLIEALTGELGCEVLYDALCTFRFSFTAFRSYVETHGEPAVVNGAAAALKHRQMPENVLQTILDAIDFGTNKVWNPESGHYQYDGEDSCQ